MPLIVFPDVPPVAGVPDLNRLPLAAGVLTGVTPFLEGLDYFGFLPGDVPQWILADDQGNAIVTPDSVVDLGYRGDEQVATYPVEQGSFESYHKVAQPQELTLRLSCGGKNMTRDLFLLELDFLRTSLTLVNVVTPDMTYRSYNVDRVDYSRKNSTGLSLITAEVHFLEIRTGAQASYSNTADASGADPQNQGAVCTAENTPAPTNQQSPLQQAMSSVTGMFANAQQNVSALENTIRSELTHVMSGVSGALNMAGVGLIT